MTKDIHFSHVSKTQTSFSSGRREKKYTFHQKEIRNAFRVAGVGQNRHKIAIPLWSMGVHARRYRALRRCFLLKRGKYISHRFTMFHGSLRKLFCSILFFCALAFTIDPTTGHFVRARDAWPGTKTWKEILTLLNSRTNEKRNASSFSHLSRKVNKTFQYAKLAVTLHPPKEADPTPSCANSGGRLGLSIDF